MQRSSSRSQHVAKRVVISRGVEQLDSKFGESKTVRGGLSQPCVLCFSCVVLRSFPVLRFMF